MMMDYIGLAGFLLAIFISGIAVGRLVEKVIRHISKNDDEDHRNKKTTAD